MLNKFKITLTGRNYEIQSINLESRELKFLQSILDEEIKDANITVSSIRRKSFGSMFIDFESKNDKTIQENLINYYSTEHVDDLNIAKILEKELELAS